METLPWLVGRDAARCSSTQSRRDWGQKHWHRRVTWPRSWCRPRCPAPWRWEKRSTCDANHSSNASAPPPIERRRRWRSSSNAFRLQLFKYWGIWLNEESTPTALSRVFVTKYDCIKSNRGDEKTKQQERRRRYWILTIVRIVYDVFPLFLLSSPRPRRAGIPCALPSMCQSRGMMFFYLLSHTHIWLFYYWSCSAALPLWPTSSNKS